MNEKNSLNPNSLLEGLVDILKNNGERLDEKAVSKKQQRFMGMVHAAQKGEKVASPEVAKVAKSMGKKDVTDFAKTKHKGLPEKVKKECGEPDVMADEELSMFSRKNVGKRSGRGQGDNPWNHLHKSRSGRGFKGRTRKNVREEDLEMEECAGVGIVDKQNSTVDVGPGTLQKNLDAFNLEEAVIDMFITMVNEGKINPYAPQYSELLNETDIHANPNKIPNDQLKAFKGAISMPGISQNKSNGSSYTQYRFGIAMAGAPEYPTQAAGAFAGDPLLATYTDEELEIVNAAAKMVGAGPMKKLGNNRSTELDNTNTKSAIGQAKKNKYGV